MEWIEHGERVLYDSPWVTLGLVDIEVPGGARFDHHVVRRRHPAAGVVVHSEQGLLLLWRHRFITRTWGWEIPAGAVEPGESLEAAAAREVFEETGWQAGQLTHLFGYHPNNGLTDVRFEIFEAEGATHVGDPTDPSEADRVEWLPIDQVRRLVREGEVLDGLSLTGLTWWLLNRAP